MTGINPDKYRLYAPVVASKRERAYPPGSFFPLIQGDALATMTLRSYAGNCLAVVEWGFDPASGESLTEAQREHLVQLGQDALELADRWAEDKTHLPRLMPTDAQLQVWLSEWNGGRSKNDIERKELNDPRSHGKYITRLWREQLGVETEEVHPLVIENRILRAALQDRDDEIRRLKQAEPRRRRIQRRLVS